MKSKEFYDVLLLAVIFVFAVVLFGITIFFKLSSQMNGLIIIADIIFAVICINYLLHKKDKVESLS